MRKQILFIAVIVTCFASSCLKDKEVVEVNDNTSRVITEFTDGDSSTLHTLALTVSTGMVPADLTELRIPPRSNLTKSVDVKVELNPGLIDAYNATNGTAYEIPPSAVYAFNTHTYTLTPESKSTQVKISVDPSALVGNEYALGFTISSVTDGEISVIKKDYLVELKAKNAFDGEYTSNGFFYHPASPRDIIDRPKTLSTVGPNSVMCELGDLGGSGYFAIFDVDAANNVTITEAPGAAGAPYTMFTTDLPASNPGYTPQWPSSADCNNVYDPVNKEFRVRYGYLGGSGWRVTEEIIRLN